MSNTPITKAFFDSIENLGNFRRIDEAFRKMQQLERELAAVTAERDELKERLNRINQAQAEPLVEQNPLCGCHKCNPRAWWMVVCSICGNKRCPHATNHELECTNSNEPGQKGSVYEYTAPIIPRIPTPAQREPAP